MATYYPLSILPIQFKNPDDGELASGFTLESYLAGTTTPTAMYTDKNGTSAGSSITLNSGGWPEVSGSIVTIWLKQGTEYKFILKDSDSNTEWTIDNILGYISDLTGLYPPVADYATLRTNMANGDYSTGATVEVLSPSGPPFQIKQGTATDDGGVFITQNGGSVSGSQYYAERRFNDDIYVTWYGATEASADNHTEITAAIAYGSSNDTWVNINEGMVFDVAQTIVPVSNMKIRGKGTIRLAATSNVRVFDNGETPVVELENIYLRDFTIDGNRSNQTSNNANNDGIKLNFVENLHIENMTVKSCGTPDTEANSNNNAVGLSLHECINFTVKRCTLHDAQHYNFQAWECVDGTIEGNNSFDPGSHCFGGSSNLRVKYIGNSLSIISSRSEFIYDNDINAGQGFWFRQFEDCVIDGNTVFRETDGLSSTPSGAACQNGNEPTLTSTPQSPRLNGILTPNQSVNGTVWSNNTITGDFEFGIYGYSGAIEQTITEGNSIDGCWSSGLIVTSGRLTSTGDTIKNSGQSVGGTITNITQANPAVVTVSNHPYANGQNVYIANVVGMTEVNGAFYTVANATTNTFELSGVNSSAFTAYTSGGIVMTTCAAIWAAGRDHKISNPMVYNAESNAIYIQGVRSTVSTPKIEGYGQSIPGSGITIRNFTNDTVISDPNIYTDTPASQSYAAIWIGDNAARVNVNGGNLYSQPAASTAIRANNRQDHNVSNVIGFAAAGGQKYKTPFRLGVDYFWVDSTGDFRIKSGSAPTSDTDGTIVGTQT